MLRDRWINKYMRLAKQFGEDDNRCYSRKIGVVLVDPNKNKILATGLNGPPRGVSPCDSHEYLRDIVWPQLTDTERKTFLQTLPAFIRDVDNTLGKKALFLENTVGCKTCPRRLIGAKSGERMEICSCVHAEQNAIYNATEDLHGSWAFCWCGVACWDCTKALINAGIERCFFIDDGGSDYSFGSRWLFEKAKVEITMGKPEYFFEQE